MKDSDKPDYRAAGLRDLPAVSLMEKKCFSQSDRFQPRQIRRFLKNPAKSITVDIMLSGGRPAGYAVYFTRKNNRTIRLYSICVLPEHSGKGVASGYLSLKFKHLEKYSRVSLEVRESNRKAAALYRSLGFSVTGKLKRYYPGNRDGLRMVRSLP